MDNLDTNATAKNERDKLICISESILIAIITIVGYLGAFSYQYGYLKYYNIPSYLIEVNLASILYISFFAIIYLSILSYLLHIIFILKINKKYKALLCWTILFFTLTVPILINEYNPKHIIRFVGISASIFLAFAIMTYQIYKPVDVHRKNFYNLLYKLYGPYVFILVCSCILFITYCMIIGSLIAKTNTHLLVTDTNPPLVILATHNESFISLEYSSSTNYVINKIHIIDKNNLSNYTLSFKNIQINYK